MPRKGPNSYIKDDKALTHKTDCNNKPIWNKPRPNTTETTPESSTHKITIHNPAIATKRKKKVTKKPMTAPRAR